MTKAATDSATNKAHLRYIISECQKGYDFILLDGSNA